MKPRVGGFFRLVAGKSDGSRRVLADWFPNLVTDAGLDRIAIGSYITRAYIGTGDATPTVDDAGMQTLLATSTTIQGTQSSAQNAVPFYGSYTRTFRFAAGTATGQIREAGVGWNPGLFARALTRDNNGKQATIDVLDDEYLDLSYQLRFYPPLEDEVSTLMIGSTMHTITVRPANVTQAGNNWSPSNAAINWSGATFRAFDGPIGLITGTPDGVESSGGTASTNSYTPGSFTIGGILSIPGENAVYGNGVSSLVTPSGLGMGRFQIGFDPPLSKTSTTTLRMRFSAQWQRFE